MCLGVMESMVCVIGSLGQDLGNACTAHVVVAFVYTRDEGVQWFLYFAAVARLCW